MTHVSMKNISDEFLQRINSFINRKEAWVTEYETQVKDFPDFYPTRDNSILKQLVKTHGLEKVMEKTPLKRC